MRAHSIPGSIPILRALKWDRSFVLVFDASEREETFSVI